MFSNKMLNDKQGIRWTREGARHVRLIFLKTHVMRQLDLSRAKWTFRDCSTDKWMPARVPGCVHQDLRPAGEIPDPFHGTNELNLQWIEHRDWEYRATFTVTKALQTEQIIELVADGLDTLATVVLNGRTLGKTENMFTPYRWNVARRLKLGDNEICIRFKATPDYLARNHNERVFKEFNDPVGNCTRIRKEQCQFGWDWGPRFVTAGIWQGIRLEAWTGNRLDSVVIKQRHPRSGRVFLDLEPEFARPDADATCAWNLSLAGEEVARGNGTTIRVDQPRLWWPAGQGEQPLYTLKVAVTGGDGQSIGTWKKRIGLRTIALDQSKDKWGRAFQFVVNGRAIFAKGANWIPAHSFVAGLKRADYARDLQSAVEANMNMMRVWGGGIYENEAFYDLCDELGLMVWQDFCFACTQYPGGDAFVDLVRPEAAAQVRRIRHRASLALWCGNNEIWMINGSSMKEHPDDGQVREYEHLFHEVLPEIVAAHDPATAYWPSSPWRPGGKVDAAAGEVAGDTHFWDVWHARQPVSDYEKWSFRFVSEFGMQSYSSPATNRTFCSAEEGNVFGPVMENHQKNAAGNQIILEYVSRLYRYPKNQDDLIYLSQLNQAHCMQVGVEHYRRLSPRCMGALYWQINDTWPVASWSSIEFTGRWKALHYVAKRFFAAQLISGRVLGEETTTIGNYRKSTVDALEVWTVNDAPETLKATARWTVMHVDGRKLDRGSKPVVLASGVGVKQHILKLTKILAQHSRDEVYVRLQLSVGRREVSSQSVWLTALRFVELPKAKAQLVIKMRDNRTADLTITSTAYQHRFALELPHAGDRLDDNYIDLYPNEPRSLTLRCAKSTTAAQLKRVLTWRSLADTY